uniref:NADH dehydrogenase subunit 6 n=1 Tax=Nyctiophylax orbicularis TaxID=2904907 RepID=A0A9E8LQD5_9NEOP|nr:NADH dehydrogenase subunit 6 [Nyctiophylax orbicularis]UZZ44202.1 NADH dehydrogenase subunit 6 [Nyctiophylax orbicularis]
MFNIKIMMIMNMLISNSILFMMVSNPINMSLIIIIQTINSCMMMNNLMNYPWFPYITFIVIIGGLMIMFMYMCMLSWNSKMKIKLSIIIMMMSIFIMNNYMMMMNKFMNYNYISMFKFNNNIILNKFKLNMIKFYIKNSTMIILIMINLLLLTLIIINKMNKKSNKPLRMFLN